MPMASWGPVSLSLRVGSPAPRKEVAARAGLHSRRTVCPAIAVGSQQARAGLGRGPVGGLVTGEGDRSCFEDKKQGS